MMWFLCRTLFKGFVNIAFDRIELFSSTCGLSHIVCRWKFEDEGWMVRFRVWISDHVWLLLEVVTFYWSWFVDRTFNIKHLPRLSVILWRNDWISPNKTNDLINPALFQILSCRIWYPGYFITKVSNEDTSIIEALW